MVTGISHTMRINITGTLTAGAPVVTGMVLSGAPVSLHAPAPAGTFLSGQGSAEPSRWSTGSLE